MSGPEAAADPVYPDRIELRGLRVLGVHGALPEERERAQPFEVDLDLELDLQPAGRSDRLADTVDYGSVTQAVAAVVSGPHAELLEYLAERVAIAALACGAPLTTAVTVSVRKLRPPVPSDLHSAGVTIRRLSSRRPSSADPATPAPSEPIPLSPGPAAPSPGTTGPAP
jgi:dihydroneopterin aldolase